MIIGILGCGAELWDEESALWAQRRIEQIIRKEYESLKLVTGHNPKGGINTWVAALAGAASIECKVVPLDKDTTPARTARDIVVAQHSELLIAIVARSYRRGFRGTRLMCTYCAKEVVRANNHVKNDACWILKYAARELKRQTQLIVVGR